jgi:hypothetical protein
MQPKYRDNYYETVGGFLILIRTINLGVFHEIILSIRIYDLQIIEISMLGQDCYLEIS